MAYEGSGRKPAILDVLYTRFRIYFFTNEKRNVSMNFATAKLCSVKLTSIWISRTRKIQKRNTILENNSYEMQPGTPLSKDFTASELMTPWRSETVCSGQGSGGP